MIALPDFQKMYEYETFYHLTMSPDRLGKLITHYETYKMIANVPGEIVECGVCKGTSLTRFALMRNLLETQDARKIIGFDNFDDTYPDTKYDEDQEQRQVWMKTAGSSSISADQLGSIFDKLELRNYEFIAGDIVKTLPAYVEKNPELKIALLNIDIDFVESTLISLEYLYDRVMPGGIILLDNYGAFHGDTKGTDMFFKERNIVPNIQKFPFVARPCYIKVEG